MEMNILLGRRRRKPRNTHNKHEAESVALQEKKAKK